MRLASALYAILTPAQRRRYAYLQAFFVFAGFVQIAGVGSIAPFIALVSDPSLLHSNVWAERAYVALGFANDTDALVALAFATMGALTISNLIAAGTTWAIFTFSIRLGIELQRDLYSSYLFREYVDLARANSSTLIASITQGATRLTYMVIQPLLTLFSQAMIVLVVIVVLVVYRPIVAASVAVIVGGGYFGLFAFVRRQLVVHGNRSWSVHESKQQLLTESLGGLKEIRLAGTERLYKRKFDTMTQSGLRSEAMIGLLGDLPRFVFETLVFCALLGLAVVLLRSSTPPGDIVAVLSLYAMTGYRMLPAAQAVFKSASQVRANADIVFGLLPAILDGRRVAHAAAETDSHDRAPQGDIELRNVTFRYPGVAEPVLNDVSVAIHPKQLTMLVGPSGSGKSTLADIVLGLLIPERGTVSVAGRALSDLGAAWRRSLGYVPQNIFLLDDTVAANIAFGSPLGIEEERIRRAARLANLDDVVAGLPGGSDYRVGERGAMLSGGQRQRLGIARALYHDASVLVLDEATSALDGHTEHEVLETLLELRKTKTVIMIAHRMSTIRAADRILLISGGRIEADGTYDGLMEQSASFRRMALRSETIPDIEASVAGA